MRARRFFTTSARRTAGQYRDGQWRLAYPGQIRPALENVSEIPDLTPR